MTELEILERAVSYLNKLSDGVDPITGEVYDDNCSIRSDRMKRFFSYLEGIVTERIEQEKRKDKKFIPKYETEDYKGFQIIKKPIPFTPLRRLIKQNEKYQFLTGKKVRELLLEKGYITWDANTNSFQNTELGQISGVIVPDNENKFGNSRVLYYTEKFQKIFIDKITDMCFQSPETEKPQRNNPTNAGSTWTKQEESDLVREYNNDITIEQIARLHERTIGAIRARLIKLGLIEDEL